MRSIEDISKLCVLRICEHEHNHKQNVHEVTEGYNYEINSSFCTYYSDHFCSVCLATKSKDTIDRIMVYHYLSEDYKNMLSDEFQSEVCFCFDLITCKTNTVKRFMERKMQNKGSVLIYNALMEDELHLSIISKMGDWKITILRQKILVKEVDFRVFCSEKDLICHETADVFPPRFLVQFNCHKPSILDADYALNLKKSERIIEVRRFNVFKRESRCETLPDATTSSNALLMSHYDRLLEQAPTMRDIIKIVIPKIKAEWRSVGYCLGFEYYIINGIERDNADIRARCEKLIETWLNTSHGCDPKVWKTLINRIKEVEDLIAVTEKIEIDLASQIS